MTGSTPDRLDCAGLERPSLGRRSTLRRYKRVAAPAAVVIAYAPALLAIGASVLMLVLVARNAAAIAAQPLGLKGVLVVVQLGLLVCAALLARAAFAPVCPQTPSDTILLARHDAPELFQRIDRVADSFGVERYDTLLLASQCNAAIERKLSLLPSRHQPRLLIGLPMLDALSTQEVCSVIAHEFGHIVHDSCWIDALARSAIVVDRTAGQLRALYLDTVEAKYVRVWADRAEPVRLALGRLAERLADAAAVRGAGAPVAAAALVRATIVMRAEGEIQRRLRERSAGRADAAPRPDRLLRRWQRRFEHRRDRTRMLHAALIWRTRHSDSHPMLCERLARMGETPRMPPPLQQPASVLLGSGCARIRQRLRQRWLQATAPEREERRQHADWMKLRWRDLDRAGVTAPLTPLEIVERADIAWRLGTPATAIAPILAARAVAGAWPRLDYRLATCLAECGDEEGFGRMLDLAERQNPYAAEAAAWIADRYALDGDFERAQAYVRRHEIAGRLAQRDARRDRSAHRLDTLEARQLPIPAFHLLMDCMDVHWGLSGTWLACITANGHPAWQLVVDCRKGVPDAEQQLMRQRLADQLLLLPFDINLVSACWQGRRIARRIRRMPGCALLGTAGAENSDNRRFDTASDAGFAFPALP